MDYNDVYNTISRKIEKYVYVSEGEKHEIRLFISTNNDICFAPKRRRNGGYMLSVSEMEKWDSLTKVNKGNKTDLVKRMRKRAESGVAMLNESGLWTDIKKELLEFLDLSDDEIRRACNLCVEAKAQFVKTSTGFNREGANVHVVKVMKEAVQDKALIKAAGGVRTPEDMDEMIKAGASRIGTSKGISLM